MTPVNHNIISLRKTCILNFLHLQRKVKELTQIKNIYTISGSFPTECNNLQIALRMGERILNFYELVTMSDAYFGIYIGIKQASVQCAGWAATPLCLESPTQFTMAGVFPRLIFFTIQNKARGLNRFTQFSPFKVFGGIKSAWVHL